MKRSDLIKIIKQEIDKVLIEQVDVEGHLAQDAFNEKVLPLLNQKLKQLKATDGFNLQIEITAVPPGDIDSALKMIRKSLSNPRNAKKYPLEVQVTELAKQMKANKHMMTGAKSFVKNYKNKFGNTQKVTNMQMVKKKARQRAAAVQRAANKSGNATGVSSGTVRQGKVDLSTVRGN